MSPACGRIAVPARGHQRPRGLARRIAGDLTETPGAELHVTPGEALLDVASAPLLRTRVRCWQSRATCSTTWSRLASASSKQTIRPSKERGAFQGRTPGSSGRSHQLSLSGRSFSPSRARRTALASSTSLACSRFARAASHSSTSKAQRATCRAAPEHSALQRREPRFRLDLWQELADCLKRLQRCRARPASRRRAATRRRDVPTALVELLWITRPSVLPHACTRYPTVWLSP